MPLAFYYALHFPKSLLIPAFIARADWTTTKPLLWG
jgi:hypothetical protein